MSKTILIAGASGYIGGSLQTKLIKAGHKVISISRTKANNDTLTWNEIKANGLPDCDAIINLAGANIIEKRWTEQRKKEIFDSRIGVNELLIDKIKQSNIQLSNYISASAVGVYPPSVGDIVYDEHSELPPYSDNLPYPQKLCRDWEKTIYDASETFKQHPHLSNCKLNIVRIGLVMELDGGFMAEILPVYKWGLGGRMGSGNQPYPWIHLSDCTSIFENLATKGNLTTPTNVEVVNAVAPGIVTQYEFAKNLASVLHRPALFWTPSFIVKLMFQDRAQLLLEGQMVKPVNTLRVLPHFYFEHPNLRPAIESLFHK